MSKREIAALLAALACSSVFVAAKFENDPVYDDSFVIGGELIHDPRRIGEVFASHTMIAQGDSAPMPLDTYRPLTLLTFFWDAWLGGRETWSYHLTNQLLHLAVVACVFVLSRRLLPQVGALHAAAVASFFGVSPQLAEAHVWINGRSDPLATLFGLLALLTWHGWRTPASRAARLAGAPALFFAGLLCKETLLFTLPSLVLWPSPSPRGLAERVRAVLPFAIAGAGYLALRSWALQGLRAAHGPEHIVRALKNLPVLWADGLSQLLAPSRLYLRSMRDEYAILSSTQRLLIGLALLLCAGLVFALRKRFPVVRWGAAWFACTLAPAAMISVVLWPGFGRYLYMPAVGLALALGELLAAATDWADRRFAERPERARLMRRLGAFVIATYLFALGLRTAVVTGDYADNKHLYMGAALAAPRPAYAFAWFGASRAGAGDIAGSIAPLERAVQLDPLEPRYLHDLARGYLLLGSPSQAARVLRAGLARAPEARSGDLRILLVQALAGSDPKAAVAELCSCLHHQPDYPDCLRAPRWMLDTRGPRYAELREELESFAARCRSARATQALQRALAEYAGQH
jgi:tetratricopeptide (TPR) repeat protein